MADRSNVVRMGLLGRGGLAPVLAVSPACNEADHLELLAASIEAQSSRPRHWVIVTNGCTDDTERVADAIAARNPEWVSALHLGSTGRRSFAAKAHAVNSGVEAVGLAPHDLVACVDGDVILPPDYFERVSQVMDERPRLGVTGGVYREPVGSKGRIGGHRGNHVPGPAQVLRAEVFQELGGYRGLEFGGLDAVACYGARQRGWETAVLDDLEFSHVRVMGTGGGVSRAKAEYLKGRQDWDLGNAFWFEFAKLIRKLAEGPVIIGGLARTAGFLRGAISRTRGMDDAFVAHVRLEQKQRLTASIRRFIPIA